MNEEQKEKLSLCDKLGGEKSIKRLIEMVFADIHKNEEMLVYFKGV
jgi:hypothetical protein